MEEGNSRDVGEVKRVMVAIDESEASFYALEWALKNLGDSIANSEVAVFTAQPWSAFTYVTAGVGDPYRELKKEDCLEDHKKDAASPLLEKAKDICRTFKVAPKTVSEVGDPKDVICNAVDSYNTDLLVVGSDGREPLKRASLGSVCVSNYCVHNVKCPFLVVR